MMPRVSGVCSFLFLHGVPWRDHHVARASVLASAGIGAVSRWGHGSVCSGCRNAAPNAGWLQRQRLIFSQSGRWKSEGEVRRGGSLPGPLSLARRRPPSSSSRVPTWSLLCTCIPAAAPSPDKDTGPVGSISPSRPHLTFVTSFRALSPNTAILGLELHLMSFPWGTQFSPEESETNSAMTLHLPVFSCT